MRRLHLAELVLAVAWLACPLAAQYTITTVAGGGVQNNVPGLSAWLQQPNAVLPDSAGNLYIGDRHNVYKLSASGMLTTVAGTGHLGALGDGGAATSASLYATAGLAIDVVGNIYVVDTGYQVVRKIAAGTGIITTVAGGGSADDGGPATAARLNTPNGVAVDGAGNLYIADTYNNRIRKVAAGTGIISTVVGTGESGYSGDGGPATGARISFPRGVALDSSGNLYFSDTTNNRVRKVAAGTGIITTVAGGGGGGDGGAATSAQLAVPAWVLVDSVGNLYFADGNSRIRKVAAVTGIITTVAGGGSGGDGGPATSAQLSFASGVALDGAGNLYVADSIDNRIRKVATGTGIITSVVGGGFGGDGGPALNAQLFFPSAVGTDSAGNLYIGEAARIRKLAVRTGIITTVAGNGTAGSSGDGGPATSARLGGYPSGPPSMAVDGAGNLYIPDSGRIRKVTAATGLIGTVAGTGTPGYGGDGGPATSARLAGLLYIAVDSAGNLYLSDSGNLRIRKVAVGTGIITTVAGTGVVGYSGDGGPATSAQLTAPQDIAVDSAGNVYFTDAYRVRMAAAGTGIITTVAGTGVQGYSGDGGAATRAQLVDPRGLAADSAGSLFISDGIGQRIRRVAVGTGIITSVAGTGAPGYSAGGGSASDAQLGFPLGIAVDSTGTIYIADTENNLLTFA